MMHFIKIPSDAPPHSCTFCFIQSLYLNDGFTACCEKESVRFSRKFNGYYNSPDLLSILTQMVHVLQALWFTSSLSPACLNEA